MGNAHIHELVVAGAASETDGDAQTGGSPAAGLLLPPQAGEELPNYRQQLLRAFPALETFLNHVASRSWSTASSRTTTNHAVTLAGRAIVDHDDENPTSPNTATPSSNWARVAARARHRTSSLIQGSAVDVLRCAMRRVHALRRSWATGVAPWSAWAHRFIPRFTIHDEVVFTLFREGAPEGTATLNASEQRLLSHVAWEMSDGVRGELNLSLPLPLACRVGPSWGAMSPVLVAPSSFSDHGLTPPVEASQTASLAAA